MVDIVDDTPAPLGEATSDDELVAKLCQWGERIDNHWGNWYTEAKECYDAVAGRQWTEDEKADMIANSKIPIVFDRISPLIDAVCGAEINGRQSVMYYPKEVNDSKATDILTQGAAWIMDRCGGDQEDSDAFRDTLIGGVGWTETRPEAELETEIIKERIDPLEMGVDPASVKRNFTDARFIRRKKMLNRDDAVELARDMGWPEVFGFGADVAGKRLTIVDPAVRYTHGTLGDGTDESDGRQCALEEWQWWEYKDAIKVQLDDGSVITIDADEREQYEGRIMAEAPARRRQYYQAFKVGEEIVEHRQLEINGFSYSAITGKRDRNKGTWFGLVRVLLDPQRWSNKLYSQLMYIMRTSSQGGLLAEETVTDNRAAFEKTWSEPAAVTWVKKDMIGGVQPKPVAQYPAGMDRLLEMSVSAIRDTSGINQEMLGMAERQQAGVLEAQRKQSAYAILSPFFDSLSSYKRTQGRLLLDMMRLYLDPAKLVRVVGDDGGAQYVPLALDKATGEYDVVVDEAPNNPNQKAQTFQVLTQMMPLLQNAELPAQFWSEMLKYSPLPASLAEKIGATLNEAEQADSAQSAEAAQLAQQQAERGANAEIAKTEAQAAKDASAATLNEAKAINEITPDQTEIII